MKRTFREPCGCTYRVQDDREEWVELCPEHKLETTTTHERWADEHKASPFPFLRPACLDKGAR